MVKACIGVGVAMGNASSTVQEEADFVVSSNNDAGVAEALQRFILEKSVFPF